MPNFSDCKKQVNRLVNSAETAIDSVNPLRYNPHLLPRHRTNYKGKPPAPLGD